ncbi:hypothetical protein DRP07_08140 [Archaeoglobales archaeon]|nr:MAG: hypothetical protein DRP07_08140 [Archaeoglobales archaeon]
MCLHDSRQKDWLPSCNSILKLHPYCSKCGYVRNISSDRGKETGYFANILGIMKRDMERRGYKISQVQIRLIMREFEKRRLNDTYSTPFSLQIREFVDIVRKFVPVSEDRLKAYLH